VTGLRTEARSLAVSGLAAAASSASGRHMLGWTLAALTLVHHVATYALGERLLERQPA